MKAALYARVSSERQAEKDLSISAQLRALRKYAKDQSYEIVKEWVDEAESARTANRPAFQEMIAAARSKSKPFDVILVWKLSRFARNREDSVIHKSILRKRGIQVVSISERVDDSPAGLLLEGVIEVIDEFYSANLSQEARRGLRETASRGFFPGGSPPIGYKLVEIDDGRAKRRTLAVDDNRASTVLRMFELCDKGMGLKEIADTVNAEGLRSTKGCRFTKATVSYVLRNDIYTGDLFWPDSKRLRPGEEQIVIKDHHPAIIDRETFRRVQVSIDSRCYSKTHPRRVSSNYLLSGLLHCEICGKAMLGGTAKSGQYRYYMCYSRNRVSRSVCTCKAIRCDRIEGLVLKSLQSHILTEKHVSELVRLTNAELAKNSARANRRLLELRKQVDSRQRRLTKLYEAIEEGHVLAADLGPRIRLLRSETDDLQAKMRKLEYEEGQTTTQLTISPSQLRRYVSDLRDLLTDGEFFEQRSFLRSFIKRVDYDYPQATVHYTIPLTSGNRNSDEVLALDRKSGVDETRTRGLLRDRQAF